jgi:hypothetical protein
MQVSPDLAQFVMEGGERPALRQIKYTLDGQDGSRAIAPAGTFPWDIVVSAAFAEK